MPCKLTFCTLSIGRLSAFELDQAKSQSPPQKFPSHGGVVEDRGGKKPRPGRTAGQRKGLERRSIVLP